MRCFNSWRIRSSCSFHRRRLRTGARTLRRRVPALTQLSFLSSRTHSKCSTSGFSVINRAAVRASVRIATELFVLCFRQGHQLL